MKPQTQTVTHTSDRGAVQATSDHAGASRRKRSVGRRLGCRARSGNDREWDGGANCKNRRPRLPDIQAGRGRPGTRRRVGEGLCGASAAVPARRGQAAGGAVRARAGGSESKITASGDDHISGGGGTNVKYTGPKETRYAKSSRDGKSATLAFDSM